MIDSAIVLAVGAREHRSQLTYNRPRTMLPALGKPMVVRAMERLYRAGIRRYTVVLGESEGGVATYLKERWMPNVELRFVIKLERYSLAQMLTHIVQEEPEPFLLSSYNTFVHGNFAERLLKFHTLSDMDLLLTGAINTLTQSQRPIHAWVRFPPPEANRSATNPLSIAEPVEAIAEIMSDTHQNLILANLAACGRDFVDFLLDLPDELRDNDNFWQIASHYQSDNKAVGVTRAGWILQVECDSDLLTLNRYLLEENVDAHILSELPYTVRIIPPVRIDPRVSVGQGAVIGPYTYLENGCSVGREAIVSNSIVLKGSTVNAGSSLDDAIVSTRGQIEL